jgi:hypothetical protein
MIRIDRILTTLCFQRGFSNLILSSCRCFFLVFFGNYIEKREEDNIVTENDPDRLLHVNNNCASRQLLLTRVLFLSYNRQKCKSIFYTQICRHIINDDDDDVKDRVLLRNE